MSGPALLSEALSTRSTTYVCASLKAHDDVLLSSVFSSSRESSFLRFRRLLVLLARPQVGVFRSPPGKQSRQAGMSQEGSDRATSEGRGLAGLATEGGAFMGPHFVDGRQGREK